MRMRKIQTGIAILAFLALVMQPVVLLATDVGSSEYEAKPVLTSAVASILLKSDPVNPEKIIWATEGYAANGFKIVLSKNKGPVYPTREGDTFHYFSDPNRTEATIKPFSGNGVYYVRVCEYLGGQCGTYSNEIEVELNSGIIVCTEDAKECSDGTFVSRVAPECDFSPCPALYDDNTGSSNEYPTVCGIKEECSTGGTCSKISKTYNNKEEMTKDGAQLKYPGACRVDTGIYLPECGVKKECSADGTCTKKVITYNNKEKMINDGAVLLYHGVCRDDTGNADFYLPECGIKEDCSSGACFEKKKTYDNKSQMIEQGAEFLYHGVCKSDDVRLGDFVEMCEETYSPVCGEVKICEGDFCRAEVQTFSNMCKLRVNRGRLLHYGGCKDMAEDRDIMQIEEKSSLLVNDRLGDILVELQELRSIVREQQNEIKYLTSLVTDLGKITELMQNSINNFITYGVDDNTRRLGAGERAAVIHSFKSAFNKLPENEEELSDVIKIANGRWPSLRSEEAEEHARNNFNNIYKRNPDTENPNDNAAVTVMAYGLRQKAENRNLDSEKQGIKTFRHIYNKLPDTTEDWNVMQAITYSGATR